MLLVVLCDVFVSIICSPTRAPFGASPARSGARHPRRYSQSETDQNQSQAGHVRCHGDLGKQGVVSGNMGGAIACLEVPDDCENLLTFRLLDHPPDVQYSRDVLPPERINEKNDTFFFCPYLTASICLAFMSSFLSSVSSDSPCSPS